LGPQALVPEAGQALFWLYRWSFGARQGCLARSAVPGWPRGRLGARARGARRRPWRSGSRCHCRGRSGQGQAIGAARQPKRSSSSRRRAGPGRSLALARAGSGTGGRGQAGRAGAVPVGIGSVGVATHSQTLPADRGPRTAEAPLGKLPTGTGWPLAPSSAQRPSPAKLPKLPRAHENSLPHGIAPSIGAAGGSFSTRPRSAGACRPRRQYRRRVLPAHIDDRYSRPAWAAGASVPGGTTGGPARAFGDTVAIGFAGDLGAIDGESGAGRCGAAVARRTPRHRRRGQKGPAGTTTIGGSSAAARATAPPCVAIASIAPHHINGEPTWYCCS